jgi:hypothetical protein
LLIDIPISRYPKTPTFFVSCISCIITCSPIAKTPNRTKCRAQCWILGLQDPSCWAVFRSKCGARSPDLLVNISRPKSHPILGSNRILYQKKW